MTSFALIHHQAVNPDFASLQPNPFEKLRHLFSGVSPAPTFSEIKLSSGKPQHETPPFAKRALADHLAWLAGYLATHGSDDLRQAIAAWIERLSGRAKAVCPSPFYQIYEGAALMSGTEPASNTDLARELLLQKNVVVLPGNYFARESGGVNPGANFIRIALVAAHEECLKAARRISDYCCTERSRH